MVARLRVLAIVASLALGLGAAPAAMAAGPVRFVDSLNDPQIDIDESAWATEWCGFAIDADVAGRVGGLAFAEDRRSVVALYVYGIRVTYRNVETGATIQLRDIGPDRLFTKDGRAYVAVTGRSATGSGVIGVVVIDLETGEVIHEAGNDIGTFNDQLCAAID